MVNACKKLNFPKEAIEVLEESRQALLADEAICSLLQKAQDSLFEPGCSEYLSILQTVAEKSGIARYTVDMVFLLLALKPLQQKYQEDGLPENLLWETMEDLTYKLYECRDVKGVWGTFVTSWFKGFYECTRFKLGRLEYEKVPYYQDGYKDLVKNGDIVLNCHIPSSGPLKEADVLESLRRAYEFYPEVRFDGKMVLICHSWLLYPPHYDVYPEGGNLRKFYDLFDVVSSEAKPENHNFWRVFNRDYDPAILDQVPADTRLRRNFLKFLKEGNPMGNGFGVIVYDGEKIV